MSPTVAKVAKWTLYPLFYVVCLLVFGYLTFPYDRLKDRALLEFSRAEAKSGAPPRRLQIDEMSSYWFSGVEMSGVRLILPPPDPSDPLSPKPAEGDKDAGKPAVIAIDEAHARVQIIPLLFGETRIDFWASVFGGEVSGVVPVGADSGPVEVALEDVDLAQLTPITSQMGVPLRGVASGTLMLEAEEGKFSKANGQLDFRIANIAVGDGKTKIANAVALPLASMGDLIVTAESKEGVLKITKFEAKGSDIEFVGDGRIGVREPWDDSNADLYVRFKFTDAYRDKNDMTRSLLGAPGSKAPALMDLADPKIKSAKRPDGFYGFHVSGPLKRLRFDPSASDGPAARPARGKTNEAGGARPNLISKPGSAPMFPLGTSKAVKQDAPTPPVRAAAPPPAPEPEPAPEAEPFRSPTPRELLAPMPVRVEPVEADPDQAPDESQDDQGSDGESPEE